MVLGLGLAVLVMAYIPSTMVSFYDDIIDKAVEQTSAHVTVWPRERRPAEVERSLRGSVDGPSVLILDDRTFPRVRDLNGYHALADRVAEVPGVTAVAAVVQGNATVSRGKVNQGIVLEGIRPDEYSEVVNIHRHFPDEELPQLGPSDLAIGFRLAEKLGVHVGEHIRVATATGSRLMRVRAVFRSGYYDKDIAHAYTALPTAQRMFGKGTEVSALAVRCTHLQQADEVTERLRGRLNYKIRNWREDNASLLAEMANMERITFFINVLVALVASVGMANVFNMFVHNRLKELAILRAVGASRLSLRSILVMEAGYIWVIGTLLGVTLALGVMAYEQAHPQAVSEETYGIGSYATEPLAGPIAVTIALAAATMAISALWSGWKAARLNPIEVIFRR
jgi:lipoprotein-releasing system permease protein